MARFPIAERTVSQRGGNGSSCPKTDLFNPMVMLLGDTVLRLCSAILLVIFVSWAGIARADDLDVARDTELNRQAAQLSAQGRYTAAIPLVQECIAIREKTLGPDARAVGQEVNKLGQLYDNLGRLGEAEALYRRALTIEEKASGGAESRDYALFANNLAVLYYHQGRFADAEPLFKRSLEIRQKTFGEDNADTAVSLINLGAFYSDQGRYTDAEPLLKQALAINEKLLGENNPVIATNITNLAYLYCKEGRCGQTEPLFKRALAIREQALGLDHPSVAEALNNLAEFYANQGRRAEAEPLLQRSLAIAEKAFTGDHPMVALTAGNLGALYRNEGRYADAEPLLKRTIEIREKVYGTNHPDVARAYNNLGELYAAEGRYTETEPLYRRALEIDEAMLGPDHPDTALRLSNLAAVAEQLGHLDEALDDSRRAIAVIGKRISEGTTARGNASMQEQRRTRTYFLQNLQLIHAANHADAATESFRVGQLASVSNTGQTVARMAARFAAGDDALAAAVRERQDLEQRWLRFDAALVQVASQPPAKRDAKLESEARARFAEIGNRLDALDMRIAKDFPQYAELSNPKPLELADAQALLASDEAMLAYVVAPRETWLWVLRHDRAGFYRIDMSAPDLAAEITRLRERLDPEINTDFLPYDAKRAFALHQKMVSPAAPLLDGAHTVFVVPDGALASLPLEVLVVEEPHDNPNGPADHRAVHWLARDYALGVLPSIGALKALREQATKVAEAGRPFVGIGDPVLMGKSGPVRGAGLPPLFRGALANVDAVRQLPPLPETADELRAVAKEMNAGDNDLYLAERATEPLLRRAELGRYRVVEFATHGLIAGDLPGLAEPALVLTPPELASPDDDGLLTASKIATFKLNADWVVLSACNTAAGDGFPSAGGLSGLAKSFFYAGARSLLVSHWSVPSQATVKLITDTFAELKRNPTIGRAEALRRAEMAMLDPSNPPEFAHPMMWAPFILAGEGDTRR